MPNNLLTINMITRKSLEVLENNLVLSRNVNRQYDDSFAVEGAKIGNSLRVRLPDRALVSDGPNLVIQDDLEQSTTVAITSQKHIGLQFTSAELALSLDDFSDRVLKPRISQLASSVDQDLFNVYKSVGTSTGTPGTTPATALVLLQSQQKLNEMAVPLSSRYATVNPAANASLVNAMTGYFNAADVISRQFKNGMMGENVLGYEEVNMSQSVPLHTCGTRNATGATVSVANTVEGDTTIQIAGGGASATIKAGDVFSITGVVAVNPQTRTSVGSLKQFVALADVTLSATGTGTITVAPMYSASHALATVGVLPAAGALVTFVGAAGSSYPQNLVYNKDAFVLATADLLLPGGVDMAARETHNGMSMRIVRQYSIASDVMPCRVDILYGFAAVRPEMACRLWG